MNQDQMDALPGALTIPLFKPVTSSGETVTAIEVREPTRGQMREILKKPQGDQIDYAIFTCTGLQPDAVSLLASRDWHKLSDWLLPFFQGPDKAGPALGGISGT